MVKNQHKSLLLLINSYLYNKLNKKHSVYLKKLLSFFPESRKKKDYAEKLVFVSFHHCFIFPEKDNSDLGTSKTNFRKS